MGNCPGCIVAVGNSNFGTKAMEKEHKRGVRFQMKISNPPLLHQSLGNHVRDFFYLSGDERGAFQIVAVFIPARAAAIPARAAVTPARAAATPAHAAAIPARAAVIPARAAVTPARAAAIPARAAVIPARAAVTPARAAQVAHGWPSGVKNALTVITASDGKTEIYRQITTRLHNDIRMPEGSHGKQFIIKAAFLKHVNDEPHFGNEPTFSMPLTTEDLAATLDRQHHEEFEAQLQEVERQRQEIERLHAKLEAKK
jgi:hypothetical protein